MPAILRLCTRGRRPRSAPVPPSLVAWKPSSRHAVPIPVPAVNGVAPSRATRIGPRKPGHPGRATLSLAQVRPDRPVPLPRRQSPPRLASVSYLGVARRATRFPPSQPPPPPPHPWTRFLRPPWLPRTRARGPGPAAGRPRSRASRTEPSARRSRTRARGPEPAIRSGESALRARPDMTAAQGPGQRPGRHPGGGAAPDRLPPGAELRGDRRRGPAAAGRTRIPL